MFSQSFNPEGMIVENEPFNPLERSFEDVNDVSAAKFSTDINAQDVEKETTKNNQTRELLKQQIEELCAATDELGIDGAKVFS